MLPAKVLAHVTDVRFGEVSAQLMLGGKWAIFDARGVRQGAHMVEDGLSFEDAVMGAYRVSLAPTPCTCFSCRRDASVPDVRVK